MQPIYLDHNATTPLLPEVAAAMAECQSAGFANPESQHQLGRRARRMLEDAREGIAAILGVDLQCRPPDRLIFTSGGTEANNLALFGMAGASGAGNSPRIAISSIEHPSVSQAAKALTRRGFRLDIVPVSQDGLMSIDRFKSLLGERPRLVSIMAANNETGVLQPIRELAALAATVGAPLHTDAVQAVGKTPASFREWGVAAMSIASHKFNGPRGVGALIVRGGAALDPILFGGFQEEGLRPGTQPVALAVGMHAAIESFHREQVERTARIAQLRDRLETGLVAAWPSAIVHGAMALRLPNTTCLAFPGRDRQALVMALDLAGVACSTGSACASGSSEPSPTLVAMGLADELIGSSIRFSLGATTTAGEIDEAIKRIARVLAKR
jgi:cysteine desulfurase